MAGWDAHRFRSADGRLDLFARIYPGDGPALVLMHGLTRNSADFEPLAERLAGRYRLVVPDQRGRGLSDHDPDPLQYRPDVYAADMFALLDGLGIDRAGLIGTSMGGLMAMVMAALRPALVAGIVLNDVGTVLDPAGIARIQGYVGASEPAADWAEAARRTAAINAVAFPDFAERDWLAFAMRLWHALPDGRLALSYDPAIGESIRGDAPVTVPPDLWPLWEMIGSVPVLLLRGELSDLLAPETVAEMTRRHVGPLDSVEVTRVGHAPVLDEPEAVAAIEAFLRNHFPVA